MALRHKKPAVLLDTWLPADGALTALRRLRLGRTRAITEAPLAIWRDPARLAALRATGLLDSDEALNLICAKGDIRCAKGPWQVSWHSGLRVRQLLGVISYVSIRKRYPWQPFH